MFTHMASIIDDDINAVNVSGHPPQKLGVILITFISFDSSSVKLALIVYIYTIDITTTKIIIPHLE